MTRESTPIAANNASANYKAKDQQGRKPKHSKTKELHNLRYKKVVVDTPSTFETRAPSDKKHNTQNAQNQKRCSVLATLI